MDKSAGGGSRDTARLEHDAPVSELVTEEISTSGYEEREPLGIFSSFGQAFAEADVPDAVEGQPRHPLRMFAGEAVDATSGSEISKLVRGPVRTGAQAIGVINADESLKRILVICPASLSRNWQREIGFFGSRNLTIGIATTKEVPATDIVIATYDVFSRATPTPTSLAILAVVWDALILDEAHYLKNGDAKRTQVILGARRVPGIRVTRRRIYLTGTPVTQMTDFLASLDIPAAGMVVKRGRGRPSKASLGQVALTQVERNRRYRQAKQVVAIDMPGAIAERLRAARDARGLTTEELLQAALDALETAEGRQRAA